ncbi:MAG TPA: fibronectin type III domain-containing protein [Gaiellaceae bacterium]|nr:fibronectin type III domain-containing protein [Gaiellaceae bacterium]
MTPRPFVRHAVCATAALVAMLLAAPSAAPGPNRGPLDGPKNLRVAAMTPHSVTLAWDAAVNSGSFTYVIEASFGYRVGAPQTQTSYTWTRDMVPGRTYSFVMWAGDAKGRQSAKSNTVTVTLPVDTTPPAAPVVSVTGTTSSTVGLSWPAVADDDYTCCTYRVFANGVLVSADNLQWTGERAVTVLRLAAATTHSFTVVAVDPSRNASAPSAAVTATTQPNTDTTGPTAPGNLYAFDFGCETWLFWDQSVDDVDPQFAIRYEVRVNGVFDGAQTGIDRWITYGTQSSNTFSVQAIDSAGNRSPTSSITLDNQAC